MNMNSESTVVYQVSERGVATVTIARPGVMNAVDRATQVQLETIWDAIDADSTVRVAVLTGAGDRAFCAGADMKTGLAGLDYWNEPRRGGFGGLSTRRLRVPVVARVNGVALGGGLELMLNCDVVIASDEATFGLPEARVGRIPVDGGVRHLLRQIPEKRALWHLLTGERISASDALRWGLVTRAVPMAQLDHAVGEATNALLAAAPLSQEAILDLVAGITSPSAIPVEQVAFPSIVRAMKSEDAEEGVAAFRERRDPLWKRR
jgi:crotonobetainyl-CoA hydratase